MRIPNWYRVEADGVRFYQAWNLHASGLVRQGFSTRVGGVSPPPFDSLNIGFGTKDARENVAANQRSFAAALDVDSARLVFPRQVHSNNVKRVDESHAGAGALDYESGIAEADALITNVPNLTLGLNFADCVPVFLLDPSNGAIGIAHAGWKGTVARVVSETIDAMKREFGTDPKKLQAAVGPAICRHCYHVGEGVAKELFAAFPHDERVIKQSGVDKWRADIKVANLILLLNAGLDARNIAVTEECTSCNYEEFFSHRREGETGRMGAWMCLV